VKYNLIRPTDYSLLGTRDVLPSSEVCQETAVCSQPDSLQVYLYLLENTLLHSVFIIRLTCIVDISHNDVV